MPKTTAETAVKGKKRVPPPVAPEKHSFLMWLSYTHGDVRFYADGPDVQVAAVDVKKIAAEILQNGKVASLGKPRTKCHGAVCRSGVRCALGLVPKAGPIYRVKVTYEVEDITAKLTEPANKLANDIRALIKKHEKKPSKGRKKTPAKST